MLGRRLFIINSGNQSKIRVELLKIKTIGFFSESRPTGCLSDEGLKAIKLY